MIEISRNKALKLLENGRTVINETPGLGRIKLSFHGGKVYQPDYPELKSYTSTISIRRLIEGTWYVEAGQ